jgi:hypothetical protein
MVNTDSGGTSFQVNPAFLLHMRAARQHKNGPERFNLEGSLLASRGCGTQPKLQLETEVDMAPPDLVAVQPCFRKHQIVNNTAHRRSTACAIFKTKMNSMNHAPHNHKR